MCPARLAASTARTAAAGAQSVQTVRILTEAKCRIYFFIDDGWQIRRQCRIEVSWVVICSARAGELEQPLGDALARAAELRDAAQQPGNVRNIAQLVRERRGEGLFV